MNAMRRVGSTVTAVGARHDFSLADGRWRGPADALLRGPVVVLAIEVGNVLVEFPDTPEAGTGARRWVSHDGFAAAAGPSQ